jgi:hypothetical protein
LEGNFVEKKEISGYGEGNYFFGSGKTVSDEHIYTGGGGLYGPPFCIIIYIVLVL